MTRTVQPLLEVDLVDLVEETQCGNPGARDALAERVLPEIEQYARNRRSIDPTGLADNVVGNFIANIKRVQFESDSKVWAYLYRSAQTGLVDQHRRRAERSLASAPVDFDQIAVEGFEQSVDDRIYVEDLLDHLTDDQSEVLQLRFIEDLTLEQTAERTGRTITAVKALQSRALRAAVRAAAAMAVLLLTAAGLLQLALDDDQGVTVRPPATPSLPPMLDDPSLGENSGGPQTTSGAQTPIEPQRASSIPNADPADVQPSPDTTGVADDGEDRSSDGAVSTTASTTTAAPSTTTPSTTTPTTTAPTVSTQPTTTIRPTTTTGPSSTIATPSTTGEVPSGGEPSGGATTTVASGATVYSCFGITGTQAQLETLGYRVTIGTEGPDVITLSDTIDDFVLGFGGNDEIRTGAGNDIVCAGGGADAVYGGGGNDAIDGQHGNDQLFGGRGTDTLHGGDGNDTFTDTDVDTVFVGGNGVDTANNVTVD